MRPLNEQAYQHIQALLHNNELNENEIYSETKISRDIGISRTPCRDAIHRLAQEGYIDILPSKGFRLHKLTKQDAIETFQIRSALEMYCTMQITFNYNSKKAQALFRSLDEILGHMYEIMTTTHSIEDFSNYDFQFHMEIIEYLNNPQFTSLFSSYMHRMIRLAHLSLAHEGRMEETYQEHFNIFSAMKSGDTENIVSVTLTHMETPKHINLYELD